VCLGEKGWSQGGPGVFRLRLVRFRHAPGKVHQLPTQHNGSHIFAASLRPALPARMAAAPANSVAPLMASVFELMPAGRATGTKSKGETA
jgi:hypothetical protein